MATDRSALQRAIEAHKGGRLAEAEVAYRQILRRNPADADALNFLGMLTCQAGDATGALELLRKSVEVLPNNGHAWVNLGNVLMANGEPSQALQAFARATELVPEVAAAWYNLGVCLARSKEPVPAAEAFRNALKLQPGHIPAYESLAVLLYRLGNYTEAAEVYREWLQYDPDSPVARHMLAATAGDQTHARADDRYVKELFDAFSSSFDENLKDLGYRAPQLLADALSGVLGSSGELDVLDAGCGTGLCGPLVRPIARRLVGVDLSEGMVAKARERGSYDELAVGELCQFMRSRAASFDVVLSADTLVYFGALEEPLAAARCCLRENGYLAFTLERLQARDPREHYRLEPHGRFAHAEEYVRSTLVNAGFEGAQVQEVVLRKERGSEVAGLLFLAQ